MVWFKRWKAQLTHHKVSEFANLLFGVALVLLLLGLLGGPILGWSGAGLFVLSLCALAWSDTFLPDYSKEDKEGKGEDE